MQRRAEAQRNVLPDRGGAIPGFANHFTVTPNKTGTFIGRCTELCGVYHSRMLFKIKIVTPTQFKTWVHQQQAAQATGGVQ